MKNKQRYGTKMKVVKRNLNDFIKYVKDQKYKISANVTVYDKKHRTYSGVLKCGDFAQFCELCRTSGIELKSYTWLG